MRLRKLGLCDQAMVRRFLEVGAHELSAYSVPVLYASRGLYSVLWCKISGNLCIFFKDTIGCFLFLPPLGASVSSAAVAEAFGIMDRYNRNPAVSRIENVAAGDIARYQGLGYDCRHAFDEYVYSRASLASLRGDRFKSKRASVNYFLKHFQSSYEPFGAADVRECRSLYARWSLQRARTTDDHIYQGMLKDSSKTFDALLPRVQHLGVIGRVVRVDGRIAACTFGYALSSSTFCILFEVTDLEVKGAGQYIFMRLCQELAGFRDINCMDDSGLANLKAVKLSYRPQALVSAFTVTRAYAPDHR
ncbi:MAG: phosphatidylglycerol lysyltransferase domain-containing protein [Candidatus Omnitrophica bacterium]|nr:phosphatidylglycerol lysyltransferase domain-containing protein [Candidatus Omnitrophota bacterium]